MRKFLFLFLMMSLSAGAFTTNTVDVSFTFTDFGLNPQSVTRTAWTPLAQFADYAGNILAANPQTQVTAGSGSVTYSNQVPGYAYRIELDTVFGSTVRTCGIPVTVVNQAVNGLIYLGNIGGLANGGAHTFYYLYAGPSTLVTTNLGSSGQVYSWLNAGTGYWSNAGQATNVNVIAGANVAVVTNGISTWTISSIASGFTNPQTLYVRTNGLANGVRGDPSQAWSTLTNALFSSQPGDTVQLLGSVYAPFVNYATNVNLLGGGTWLTISNSSGLPGILTSNSYLKDLRITNVSDANFTAAIGNASRGDYQSNGNYIIIKDCFVYSPSIAVFFKFIQNTGAQYQATEFLDSVFEGNAQALEVWGSYTKIRNCRLTVPHAHNSTENFANTLTFNDNSTNLVQGCVIEALGPTNAGANTGILLFKGSTSEFDGCLIRMQAGLAGTQTNYGAGDVAIVLAENNTTAKFNGCVFQLAPPGSNAPVQLCYIPTQAEAPTSGKLEFNDCWYSPETNGVIFQNHDTNTVITVRGGNLKRSNFLHPEFIYWQNTIESTNADVLYLVNSNGNVIMDTRNYILNDETGMNSIIWGNGIKVLGTAGVIAVDWSNRQLDDSTDQPTVDWQNRSLQGGFWQTASPFKVSGLTNTSLSANQLVGTDANLKEVPVIIGAGLTLSGPPYTLSGAGGSGGVVNIAGMATNLTESGWFCLINPTNTLTNWFYFSTTNYQMQFVGTNGGGGYKTNTVLLGNGSTSNMVQLINPSGQTTFLCNTNGAAIIGTNNQFVFDTSGNLTISGNFIGNVPYTSLPQAPGASTLANPNIGAASWGAVGTAVLLDAIGNTSLGLALRLATGYWTNSAQSSASGQIAGLNVTNVLNANQINGTNGLALYGTGPTTISSTANGMSNVMSFTTGSNGMTWAAGSYSNPTNVFGITNALGANGFGFTIFSGATFTNQNFGTGIGHFDSNGKQTSSPIVATDFGNVTGHTVLTDPNSASGVPFFADVASTFFDQIGNAVGGVAVRDANNWTNSKMTAIPAFFSGSLNVSNFLGANADYTIIRTNASWQSTNAELGKQLVFTNNNTTWTDAVNNVSTTIGANGVTNSSWSASQFLATDANSGTATTLNGSTLTNLTYRYTTNAITALAIGWGKAYETNIGANFTITLAAPGAAYFETSVIMVTNSTSTDFKVTMPAGVWGPYGSGTPAVAWCSNSLLTEIDLKHYGQQMTNMTVTHYAP